MFISAGLLRWMPERSFARLVSTAALVALAAPAAADVPFSGPLLVDGNLPGARTVAVADVDSDGDPDLLSASQVTDSITWYENDGAQGFTPHLVAAGADGANGVAAVDVDADGDIDLLSSSFDDDTIAWYENDGTEQFTAHSITTAIDGPRAVAAADLDGDGDIDALSASSLDSTVAWYENDGSQQFTLHAISTTVSLPRSVAAVDLDADGDLDVLVAADFDDALIWYENDGSQSFTARAVPVGRPIAAAAADVDGDGDLDLLSASAFFNRIAWHENDGSQSFTLHVVDAAETSPRSVAAVDVDTDGDTDLVAAAFAGGLVAWYENDGAQGFTRRPLSTAVSGAVVVAVADVDVDGDADVVAAAFSSGSIEWFENRALHRSSVFLPATPIDLNAFEPRSLSAVDLDGDGDLDAVASRASQERVSWYENGAAGPGTWVQEVISTASGFDHALGADLDADGQLDVVAAGADRVVWFELSPRDGGGWIERTIETGLGVADWVSVADLDGDGDLDAVSADSGHDTVRWHENLLGDASQWVTRTVSSGLDSVSWAGIGDVDGDGDLDALSHPRTDREVIWHENLLGDASTWTDHTIAINAGAYMALELADLDGDGDLDLLAASTSLGWFENVAGDGSVWTRNNISFVAALRAAAAADVDGDGDLDLLTGGVTSEVLAWHENVLGDASSWQRRPIAAEVGFANGVVAADFDGDGDRDLMVAMGFAPRVETFENRGGQFALPTADAAPLRAGAGRIDALLAVDAEHRGRAGDGDLALATFELLFEEQAGDPLTTAEAEALVEELSVFRDDGSGAFEPGLDLLVTSEQALTLTAGVLSLELPPAHPDLQVAFGETRKYFLTATWTADAAAQTPETLLVTHLTAASSTGVHAEGGAPLTLEFAADVSSSQVEINDPPVAVGDPTPAFDEDDSLLVPAPGVLANDADEELDPLTAVLETPPANAVSFALMADGSFSYTPVQHFSGADGFTYRASDGIDLSDPVAVSLTVTAVADPPSLAVAGGFSRPGYPVDLTIIASLVDADGSETLAFTIAGVPPDATLSAGNDLGGGVWSLTPVELAGLELNPAAGFTGAILLNVTAIATESSNGDTAQTTAPLRATVGGVIFYDSFESGDTGAWSAAVETVVDTPGSTISEPEGSTP